MGMMNWSLKLPWRIYGITVRLHLLLVMFLAVELLSFAFKSYSAFGLLMFLATEAALLVIILLHEMGHCFAARRAGGRADEILLWPLGGLAYVHAPNTPDAQMRTAIGGPSANVVIGLALGLVLLLLKVRMFFSFESWYYLGGESSLLHFWLQRVFMLNTIILMFNLLPAFPLDGGRMLQCYLWRRIGFEQATLKAIFFGNICAIGLAIIGIFWESFILIFIALFIYMQSQQTKFMLQEGMLADESLFGYDFSGGYTTLEASTAKAKPKKPGLLKRWAAKRQEQRLRREKDEWEQVQRRVDSLLAKVSEHGLHSLTDAERKFLREASKRYQDR